MSEYKTYAKPGSFTEFQIDVPDQTKKVKAATAKRIQGMQTAQKFLQGNRALYLEAQRQAQQQENLSRETNFDLQNIERDNYRKALERDYKTGIDNVVAQSKGSLAELQQISEFSQTAFQAIGAFQKQREDAERLAAHDIFFRTGLTYKDLLSLQKINDNLTKAEFEQTQAVQDLTKGNQDPSLTDALFKVWQNRNSKVWFEHKALLTNTVNTYPEFFNTALANEMAQSPNGVLEDVEATLTRIRQDFIRANYLDTKVRPEVLEQTGIYSTIRNYNNDFRKTLQREKRAANKKELEMAATSAMIAVIDDTGLPGAAQFNTKYRSRETRQTFFRAINARLKSKGPKALDPAKVAVFLHTAGYGSNGQSLAAAFADDVELGKVFETIRFMRNEAIREEESRRNNEQLRVDNLIRTQFDVLTQDEDGFTEAERQGLFELARREGGDLYTSPLLDKLSSLTNRAQFAQESKNRLLRLAANGQLTQDAVRDAEFSIDQEGIAFQQQMTNLARIQEQTRLGPAKSEIEALQELVVSGNSIVKVAFKNDKNNYTVQRAQAYVALEFKKAYQEAMLAKDKDGNDVTEAVAIESARARTAQLLQSLEVDAFGNYTKFLPKTEVQQKNAALFQQGKQFKNSIDRIIITKTGVERNKAIVDQIGAENLKQSVAMFNADMNPPMPVAIEYTAERLGVLPLDLLQDLAPIVGEQINLDPSIQAIRASFKPKFYGTRAQFPTRERISRANVGDQNRGREFPVRPAFQPTVLQYVSGDPAIKDIERKPRGRIVYDAIGHGGDDYHNHYQFETVEDARRAIEAFQAAGYNVTSWWRPEDTDSAHSLGLAIDVAPPLNLPRTPEAEARWSAEANAVIGFDPLANE